MSSLRLLVICVAAVFAALSPVQAEMTGLARVDARESGVRDTGDGVALTLALSQPVPWRVFTLDDPRRLVLDFSEVIWPDGIEVASSQIDGLRMGVFQPGWSRMVVDLSAPLGVETAELVTATADGSARLT